MSTAMTPAAPDAVSAVDSKAVFHVLDHLYQMSVDEYERLADADKDHARTIVPGIRAREISSSSSRFRIRRCPGTAEKSCRLMRGRTCRLTGSSTWSIVNSRYSRPLQPMVTRLARFSDPMTGFPS
jgi:hypothetical protein